MNPFTELRAVLPLEFSQHSGRINGQLVHCIIDQDAEVIAVVFPEHDKALELTRAVTALPELLTALESIERRIGGDMGAIEAGETSRAYIVSALCCVQDMARAALAKARNA